MSKSLRGQFLIASPKLIDPNFAKTVILIVQHDDGGAMGVVVNRPLEISVADACKQALEADCFVEGRLHHGGPCEGPLMAVHSVGTFGETEVVDGVFFSTEKPHLEELLGGGGLGGVGGADDARRKFIIGYAGWGAGQLEGELASGSWLLAHATARETFADDDPWNLLRRRAVLSGYVDATLIPDDPSVN